MRDLVHCTWTRLHIHPKLVEADTFENDGICEMQDTPGICWLFIVDFPGVQGESSSPRPTDIKSSRSNIHK